MALGRCLRFGCWGPAGRNRLPKGPPIRNTRAPKEPAKLTCYCGQIPVARSLTLLLLLQKPESGVSQLEGS